MGSTQWDRQYGICNLGDIHLQIIRKTKYYFAIYLKFKFSGAACIFYLLSLAALLLENLEPGDQAEIK